MSRCVIDSMPYNGLVKKSATISLVGQHITYKFSSFTCSAMKKYSILIPFVSNKIALSTLTVLIYIDIFDNIILSFYIFCMVSAIPMSSDSVILVVFSFCLHDAV